MATESDLQLYSGQPSGPLVRTLNVTTFINGVATTVQMEVAALADKNGNLLDIGTSDKLTADKLEETNTLLRAMVYLLCDMQNTPFEQIIAIAAARGSVLNLSS